MNLLQPQKAVYQEGTRELNAQRSSYWLKNVPLHFFTESFKVQTKRKNPKR